MAVVIVTLVVVAALVVIASGIWVAISLIAASKPQPPASGDALRCDTQSRPTESDRAP